MVTKAGAPGKGHPCQRKQPANLILVSRLVLVPSPIGNLADITARAVETLKAADVVACEDTRHSRTLLQHHGIATPTRRIDAHTVDTRGPALLNEHALIAYLTDAGTPGISDPGADFVRLALKHGHEVETLPGPTAFVPALINSGLDTARFAFEGFLPRKGRDRKDRLAAIAERDHTTVLYEAPARLAGTLHDLAEAAGPERQGSFSRELSKRFEETRRGSLSALADEVDANPVKGECVVVVAGRPPQGEGLAETQAAQALAGVLLKAGVARRTVRDALEATGVPRNTAYDLANRGQDDG